MIRLGAAPGWQRRKPLAAFQSGRLQPDKKTAGGGEAMAAGFYTVVLL
ncbi:MAG: hypothetical protein KBI46_04970 [Phycisphaerae bacterium]|nr:hypothetical protein [Phycisphaerae bacterium]HRV21244.1 hypothetical protein [Anaerohalosphaeraceae bacterium]